jgi:peptidoglycan hydrolase-like protein with peptidoglycan-binding domain
VQFRLLFRHRGIMATASAAAAVAIAGGVIATVTPPKAHEAMSRTANSQPNGQQGTGSTAGQPASQGKPTAPPKPLAPLQVVAVTPADGGKDANGAAPIKITFNEAVAASTTMPTVVPKVSGTWSVSGDTITFQPTLGWKPGTHVTVTIPGGKTGVQAAGLATQGTTTTAATDIGLLAESDKVTYTTGSYSTLRLQELLTQLGYLPLTWTPADPAAPAIPGTSTNAQMSAAYEPPAGSFTFESGYPWQLTNQWKTGKGNTLDTGAVMAFQSDNGLTMDGVAGPALWAQLFKAVAQNKQNPNGYTYSLVDQKSPERLRVYHNGQQILSTLVNTGVPGAGTQDGTFPVYERFKVTEMKGTNPDGTKYDDIVKWVSYFNGGDALHYFPRPGYGYYQSVGCVEMQLDPAKYIWRYTTYGSLVTVLGPEA